MAPNPKNSMTAHAGHVKRKVDRLKKFLVDNVTLSKSLVDILNTQVAEVYDTFASMESKWTKTFMDKVMESDEADNTKLYDELDQRLQDSSKMVDDVVADASKALRDFDAHQGQDSVSSGNPNQGQGGKAKFDNSFKPPTLLSADAGVKTRSVKMH